MSMADRRASYAWQRNALYGVHHGQPAVGIGLVEAEEAHHVAVVLFLPALGAQVESELVDDLDAVLLEPFFPAVGADGGMDAPAQVVAERRARQLPRPVPVQAAGPLAAERAALPRPGPCRRLGRGRRGL